MINTMISCFRLTLIYCAGSQNQESESNKSENLIFMMPELGENLREIKKKHIEYFAYEKITVQDYNQNKQNEDNKYKYFVSYKYDYYIESKNPEEETRTQDKKKWQEGATVIQIPLDNKILKTSDKFNNKYDKCEEYDKYKAYDENDIELLVYNKDVESYNTMDGKGIISSEFKGTVYMLKEKHWTEKQKKAHGTEHGFMEYKKSILATVLTSGAIGYGIKYAMDNKKDNNIEIEEDILENEE